MEDGLEVVGCVAVSGGDPGPVDVEGGGGAGVPEAVRACFRTCLWGSTIGSRVCSIVVYA